MYDINSGPPKWLLDSGSGRKEDHRQCKQPVTRPTPQTRDPPQAPLIGLQTFVLAIPSDPMHLSLPSWEVPFLGIPPDPAPAPEAEGLLLTCPSTTLGAQPRVLRTGSRE